MLRLKRYRGSLYCVHLEPKALKIQNKTKVMYHSKVLGTIKLKALKPWSTTLHITSASIASTG
jgi:hypothetical protein